MKFNKVNIPKLPRNKYDYVAQGSGISTIINYNTSDGSGSGDLDTSVFAQRDENNTFTKDNTFRGGFSIDNPFPSVELKRNSIQVAALGYDAAKLCVSLSSTGANKALNLYDDGRFEFGDKAIYHAGNSNLNTVNWAAKILACEAIRNNNAVADLMHDKGGSNYVIWDASNSNLNTVDWKAKSVFSKEHIQSENFVSGYTGTGCRISADGKAECTDLWVRGTMNIYELIVNKINATNGALAVSDSGKVALVSGTTLTLTGDNDNMNTFRVGDVLKCQRFTGKNVKLYFLTVTAISGLNVTFSYRSGGSGANTVATGDVLVRWNSNDANRKGLLYLTASDSQAPYMDVMYDEQVRLRLGRLDGIADSTFPTTSQPSGFGLYAQNAFLKGVFVLTSGKTVDGEITAASNKASAAQTAANGAKSVADAAQSAANSANNAITSIRTELSAVDGKITLAVNETKTYTNNAINNLQIGNRNYARGTATLKTYTLSSGAGSLGYPTTGLKKGDVITVSFEIDINIPSWTSGTKMLQFDQNYNYMSFYNFPQADNKKGWLKRTAQLTINNVYNSTNPSTEGMTSNPYMRMDNISTELANSGYVKVRNFKVEKGNKATDWTPAPEDAAQDAQDKANAALNAAKTYTNSEISVVNGKINLKVDSSTFNALGNRVSSCESRITQTENSIKLKADQTTVTGINSRLQSAEAKITPDAIRLTVIDQTTQIANNAINALEIGGTNLLLNTALLTSRTGWGATWDTSKVLDGRYSLKQVSTGFTEYVWKGAEQTNSTYLAASEGDVFTASIYSFTDNRGGFDVLRGADMEIRYYNSAGARITQSLVGILPSYNNTWQRFTLTGICPAGTARVGFAWHVLKNGTIWVNGMKLERGSKATAWSASPYDTPTAEQIKSQFTMDSSGISILGKKIALTGVVTFNSLASDAQNKINAAQSTANNAQSTASNAQTSANNAQSTANTARTEKIELARLGTTVISGGYIKTTLINADELIVNKISAATGTFSSITTTGGTMRLNESGVRFVDNDKGIAAGIGIVAGIVPPAMGISIPLGVARTTKNAYLGGNVAAFFSAGGAAYPDTGGLFGNCAIWMGDGAIYGLKLKLRRVRTSTTLDIADVMIISLATSTINITLPSMGTTEQERINNDGRFIMIGKRGSGNINVQCKRYNGWNGYTTSALTINNSNHYTFVYDGVNDTWDAFSWGE